MYSNDNRTVMTLDAGGTNLVFNAIRENKVITAEVRKPAFASDLNACLNSIRIGFEEILLQLDEKPVAISFAFPGPADYPNGIIGGFLPNFPCFREGVALGAYLQNIFSLPVFINNDADLFTYGEALGGVLPDINQQLLNLGNEKQYKNLIGFTWGTGLGMGITVDRKMHIGDNSCSEVFCLPCKGMPDVIAEEGASIRAVKRVYNQLSGNKDPNIEPFDIFQIAEGTKIGDQKAAIAAFAAFGEVAGEIIAVTATLIDGIVVIGGGICNASQYIMPSVMKILKSKMKTLSGETLNRLQMEVFNLDKPDDFIQFAQADCQKIPIIGSSETANYYHHKKIGIITSKLGASYAVAIGAYAFALNELDNIQ
ncbi:MAG: ROK family protein [Bacteroidales bacterium]|jgi:predicted NBD/HSP70 family sugar kinase|nr:ROK family protein [Bacteroidales bacterium]